VSHFWGKLIRMVPRFTGTPEEAKDNTESHSWRTVRLADRFNEVNNSSLKVTECSSCGILAQHHASSYPCGTPPEELSLEELVNQKERGPTLKP
jgi:hypothetical protein